MQKETVPRNPWSIPARSRIPCSIDWTSSRWSLSTMGYSCGWNHTHHLTQQEYFHHKNKWWLHSNKQGSNTMPLRHRSDFKHCPLCNDHNKKQQKNHTCLFTFISTNNGSWHKVHLLHGGIGKALGGLLTIHKSRRKRAKSWVNEVTRYLQFLARTFENGFREFNSFCYRWIVYSWRRSTVTDGGVKTTPQVTLVRDAKECNNLAYRWIDDHRMQSDFKKNCNIQKERTLHLALRMRGEPMTTWPPRPRAPST